MHPHPDQRDDAGFSFSPVRSLLVMALMGALLAVAPSSASAQTPTEPEAEKTTSLSACVGDAIEEYGFVDLDDVAVGRDAINCLAYYGITVGRTADPPTYDPSSNVTRSQMALFLYRAATVAGLDFTPQADDPAAMFSDISEMGDEWQTAIKALYAKGIMTGRDTQYGPSGLPGVASSDTFVPHEPINRAEMGVYLRNLVRAASPDLFTQDGELAEVETPDSFSDAHTSTPGAVSTAIAEIYELGITVGRGPGEYDPAGLVTRWQMALFITRTLAHTTARPVGFTVQQDGATLVVSERGRDFQPLEDSNTYVDVFTAALDDVDDAFNKDGECNERIVTPHEEGHYLCEIDSGDIPLEDGDAVAEFTDAIPSDGLAVWLWLGDRRDEFQDADEDDIVEHVFDGDTLPPPAATELEVTYSGVRTDSAGDPREARMGSTVTVHVQLQGAYPDEIELVDVPAPAGGVTYDLDLTLTRGEGETATIMQRPLTSTLALDEDGSGSFKLLAPTANDLAGLYTSEFDLRQQNVDSMGADLAVNGEVVFSGGDAVASYVEFTRHDRWVDAGTAGSRPRNVTVTVYDQYGRPANDVDVLLIATDTNTGTLDPEVTDATVTTRRNGRADFRYTYPAGNAETVTLTAGIDADASGDSGHGEFPADCDMPPDNEDEVVDANESDLCATATVYFADEAPADNGTDTYRVLYADTDAQSIVVQQERSNGDLDTNATPIFVDYSDAKPDELDVDGVMRKDTPAERRAAFDAALEEASSGETTATLTWDTTGSSWEFSIGTRS